MQDWTHRGQVFYDPQHVSASHRTISCFQEVLLEEEILLDWLLYCHLGNFDPAKSTVRTLIQHDLGLPWCNFGSNCVKVLLAEAILELFEYIPGGERAALWKNWSNSRSERGATTAKQRTMGKGKHIAQCVNQNAKMVFFLSLLSLFFFKLVSSFFFFCSFEELVLLTSAGTDS